LKEGLNHFVVIVVGVRLFKIGTLGIDSYLSMTRKWKSCVKGHRQDHFQKGEIHTSAI